MSSINIRDLHIIYISPDHNEKYHNRKIAIEKMLNTIGCVNISHYKSGTEKYPQCLVNAVIDILQNNLDKPFLLLEDDVAWTGVETIEIPEDADAVYLGISYSGGDKEKDTHIPGLSSEIKPYSSNQCRVFNMLSAHAILYISRRYKEAVIREMEKIKDIVYNSDVMMSRIQRNYNVYANNMPVFYQDDDMARGITKIKFRFGDQGVIVEWF